MLFQMSRLFLLGMEEFTISQFGGEGDQILIAHGLLEMSYNDWILNCQSTIRALQIFTQQGRVLWKLVWTQGTSPQLYACMGGRAKRRRPNLWPYGQSLLVIGLEIQQDRVFNNQGFFMHFIVSYLSTFSNYYKTAFENY